MSLDSRLERILAGKPQSLLDAVASTRVLMYTAALLEQCMDTVLAPLSLHMREYLALHLLADSVHEPLSPSTLSVSLNATRTQITRLLDSLEAKGLVVRMADKLDRRSLQLRLTPEGAALLEQAMPLVHGMHMQAWAPLGEAGTHAMHLHLRKVHDNLQALQRPAARPKTSVIARPLARKTSSTTTRTDDHPARS